MMGNTNTNIVPSKLNSVSDIYKCPVYYKLEAVKKNKNDSSDSSIVYIGYTKKEMVFLFKNWQKGINASSRGKDPQGLMNNNEDAVYILLGANGKGKDSYWIGVNPLGAVLDKAISSSGISEWDGDIKANCKVRKDGWDALIEIPFSSISYSKCIWGLQILRLEMNKMLLQYLFPNKTNNILQSEGDLVLDFKSIKNRGKFDVSLIPSARAEIENKNIKYFAGGTIRYKNGTNDLLDIAILPDYSELEADVQQFNLNRLPYNYPEKRPYFVEGSSLIKSPVSLFRSRNVENILYGLKYYDITSKSSFITYLIDDTIMGKSSISRFVYSPSQALKVGSYFQVNDKGNNVISGDFDGYIKRINLDLQGQLSNNVNNNSNLYYLKLSREYSPGLSMVASYTSIDSQFINPFDKINIYFDGANKWNANISYYYLQNKKYVLPSFKYEYIKNKYNGNRINDDYDFSFTAGYLPLFAYLEYDYSHLDYLGLPNSKTQTVTIGGGYMRSSWNQVIFTYTFGQYLGGTISQFSGNVMMNLYNMANIGLVGYKIKSPFDDMFVSQIYGQISLYRKYLFLKPYVNYTMDNIANNKTLSVNGILSFEPRYMSGVYLALSQVYDLNNGIVLKSNKDVFKIQVGISINK